MFHSMHPDDQLALVREHQQKLRNDWRRSRRRIVERGERRHRWRHRWRRRRAHLRVVPVS